MRNIQEFIDKKIAVEATDEFKNLCDKKGLVWSDGRKMMEYNNVGKYIKVIKEGYRAGRIKHTGKVRTVSSASKYSFCLLEDERGYGWPADMIKGKVIQ